MRFVFSFRRDAYETHKFILQVGYWIRLQSHHVFHWIPDQDERYWPDQLYKEISHADCVVAFLASKLAQQQQQEVGMAPARASIIVVEAQKAGTVDLGIAEHATLIRVRQHRLDPRRAAKRIVELAGGPWLWNDGLPLAEAGGGSGLFFHYEKQIVEQYGKGLDPRQPSDARLIREGLSTEWPELKQPRAGGRNPVEVEMVGRYQEGYVLVAADDRVGLQRMLEKKMALRESEWVKFGR